MCLFCCCEDCRIKYYLKCAEAKNKHLPLLMVWHRKGWDKSVNKNTGNSLEDQLTNKTKPTKNQPRTNQTNHFYMQWQALGVWVTEQNVTVLRIKLGVNATLSSWKAKVSSWNIKHPTGNLDEIPIFRMWFTVTNGDTIWCAKSTWMERLGRITCSFCVFHGYVFIDPSCDYLLTVSIWFISL